ncbi:MAG: ATP-binding cassette domain-containing protein, partial [Candidatus Eremiobacteraeota bacterium]|nr:ATP-binding cassette domain-containing protein [Candidatus Eremiobacteraeota bacterium]
MIGRCIGSVTDANAGLVRALLPGAAIGDGAAIYAGQTIIRGVVRAVASDTATIAPSGAIDGIVAGDLATTLPAALRLPVGMAALGRAFDACGAAMDGGDRVGGMYRAIDAAPPSAAERSPVNAPLWTGVKAIDALLTIGRGARVGLFGAPGAGKSTLLSMLARGMSADAVVVGLIGERGREAAEWIERLDARTTVVCAPSDRSAAERISAAKAATVQAAELRARGLDVLLILDSLARFGAALREVAVACGEPVGRGGFPSSVFAELARLVESAGKTRSGSVTLVATVLSDGSDERDPLSDAARSLLDGHIALSSALAHAGRYPAIDVLASASRTMAGIVTP